MTDATLPKIPEEPGRWRALLLAAVMHAALFGLLYVGIRWQSEVPAGIEAEIWSPQLREAAPRPQPPVVKSETEIRPVPKPVVREPIQTADKPEDKPDIALEQEKKRKAQALAKLEAEQRDKLRKQEEKREQQQKQKEAQLKREAEARREAEAEAAKKKAETEKQKKLAADKKRQQEAAEAERAEAREKELQRIAAAIGTGGSGDAAQSEGSRIDGNYAQRVAAKIKSNITFNTPDNLPGNPAVEFVVNLLPDGSVAGIRKTRSSGIPGFDDAVARAIERAQPYPKDKSGNVPGSFIGIHRPKDQ